MAGQGAPAAKRAKWAERVPTRTPRPGAEMYEKERPTPWPYDRGLRRNWEEVMGRR